MYPRKSPQLLPWLLHGFALSSQGQSRTTSQPSSPPEGQLPDHASSKFCTLEDQVICPICLEVFHNPVTTTCGHNFCMSCLQAFWDHQATTGETLYYPQCWESFPSRLRLRKNVVLEMVTCFTQAKGQTFAPSCNLAGPRDMPCDFCAPQKLKSVKSCLDARPPCARSTSTATLRSRCSGTTSCWSPCGISRAACARSIASCRGCTAAQKAAACAGPACWSSTRTMTLSPWGRSEPAGR